jgi:ribonuclease HIII
MTDSLFIEACQKYNELQDKIQELRLLKGCLLTIENIIYYLEHVDVNERNPNDGKPIYKTKDVIMEIKNARELIKTVRDLEKEVKEGASDESSVRGNLELGYYD